VKCPVIDPDLADPVCVGRLLEEITIVAPKLIVVMGEDALATVNDLGVPLSQPLRATPGELQQLTPSMQALLVPNIDDSLDDESAKRAFWNAFRVVGRWWDELPPY
jgi:uracil-DNA glycosylase